MFNLKHAYSVKELTDFIPPDEELVRQSIKFPVDMPEDVKNYIVEVCVKKLRERRQDSMNMLLYGESHKGEIR